jgi:hypothetical protein
MKPPLISPQQPLMRKRRPPFMGDSSGESGEGGDDWQPSGSCAIKKRKVASRALVVRRIRESRFEDSNLFANFAGEREDSNPKAKDSNLCCQVKITQNCSRSYKFGQLLVLIQTLLS